MNVEFVGTLVAIRVAICRARDHVHFGPSRDLDSSEHDVAGRQSRERGQRAVPAQGFLHGARHERSIGAHRHELSGMGKESNEQRACTAIGGVACGVHQLPKEGHGYVVGNTLAIDLHPREQSDQVLTRCHPPFLEQQLGEAREQGKVSQTLCQMPLILVASQAYLSRRGVPRTPADLAAHDCINVALPHGVRAQWTFIPRGGSKRSRVTVTPTGRLIVTDELDAVADAAVAGLGLTVSSAENVLDALRDGRLVRVMDDYTVIGNDTSRGEIIVQYPRRKYLPQKVRVLVDFLLERLKGRNPLDIVASSQDFDAHE